MKRIMKTAAIVALCTSLFSINAFAGRVTQCTEQCTNDYAKCMDKANGYWDEVWCYAAYEGDMAFCLSLGPDE